jgi:hypothetical protein
MTLEVPGAVGAARRRMAALDVVAMVTAAQQASRWVGTG